MTASDDLLQEAERLSAVFRDEAERIEPGASRWGKEIAFTQSYWSGMRKEPAPWIGPLPRAAT